MNRKIAEGGMGAVYEAVQFGVEGFKKTVAVKSIIEDLSTNQEFVEMFIGEAKLVADLVHENIIQVYQLERVGNTLYIVMEYIDGVDLDEFTRRHQALGREIPIDLCAFIASRICRGLDYAHRKTDAQGNLLGVVHRDISPRNIMITRLGVVKLGDFGIAKARNILASREGDVLMGKAQYMSPEQSEYRETDPRSDIFSLGIVFFQLLTGVSIFDNPDTSVTLQNVGRAKVPSIRKYNPNVPEELEEILKRALQRRPEKRFQSAGEMGYALEYYMYHDRFGPTNVTMEKYLRELFPEKALPQQPVAARAGGTAEIGPKATMVVEREPTSTTRRRNYQ
ncbi:MAG: serine/threonine protein kinase [Planctomycetes bacterium]|nr:serine/threonine protein kinase [Planctomycetota bacterium]